MTHGRGVEQVTAYDQGFVVPIGPQEAVSAAPKRTRSPRAIV
ncbi:hypothetical protein [Asticcacaulis sp. MM231]